MILTAEDARSAARRRLPRLLFDYLEGGASGEAALTRNVAAFGALRLRQRVLRDVSRCSLATRVLGFDLAAPIVLGPVGFVGAFRRDGEILAARAAHAFGVPYCLSMFSICRLETLRARTGGPLWMQLYVTRDRTITAEMMRRARTCDVDTLCITVDTPAGGWRERDMRSGLRGLTRLTPRLCLSLARKPGWSLNMMPGGMPHFGNLEGIENFDGNAFVQGAKLGAQIDPALTFADLARLRDSWQGRLIVKGCLDPEDAARAVEIGADAIIVSNHGGRQVDDFPATLDCLPGVVAAVGGRVPVMLDSGIRRGGDIVKALALGASNVLLGRAYAYAVAAGGESGVRALLASLAGEMESIFRHIGVESPADLSPGAIAGRD